MSVKAGDSSSPTLVGKGVSEFSITPDMRRIAGMKADPLGYNEKVNAPVSDPTVRSYATRIRERADSKRKASDILKGNAPPLGHIEAPSLEKMRAIASLQTMPQPVFDTSDSQTKDKAPPSPPAAPIRGVGAAYPVNQILSSGKTPGPVSLREGTNMASQHLSKETVQALEMANKAAQEAEQEKKETEQKPPSVAKETRAELDDAEKEFEPNLPLMDFAAIEDARSMLMSKKRREDIEGRLSKLDIADMVMKRELAQTVSIVPDKLSVTLRTFTQSENLWVMKYVFDFPGSALYVQELINTCRLVCSITAINGAYLPDHRRDVGNPSEKIVKEDFEKKFYHIASMPVQLVADFSVQLMWFQDRVNKLLTLDELKNG